jgi:hypothetical protein
VLSLAAREASVVSLANVAWADPDPMVEADRRIGFVRDAAGDGFDDLEIELAPSCAEVTDDRAGVLERVAPGLRNADPKMLADHPNVLIGSVGQIAEQLHARRERLSVSYITVNADQVDSFAPVVAALAGQ